MNSYDIGDGYELREVDADTMESVFAMARALAFEPSVVFNTTRMIADDSIESVRNLRKQFGNVFRLRLVVYKGDEVVGWHIGDQLDGDTFYMRNSAILQAHRRKGLYSRCLQRVLAILREHGFQRVTSRHRLNNNAVIIPKLKAGFVITGFETSVPHGQLVVLTYFINEYQRRAFDYRIGDLPADDDILRFNVG